MILFLFVLFSLSGMSVDHNMSLQLRGHTMKMHEQLEPTLKIHVASTLPGAANSTQNGTNTRGITMTHVALMTLVNSEITETLTSKTSANTVTCSGNGRGRGSVLKQTVNVTMGGGLLTLARAPHTPVALPALLHLPLSLNAYQVTQIVAFAVGPQSEVAAAVHFHHQDLKSLTRPDPIDITRVINRRRRDSLKLNVGMGVKRRSELDARRKVRRRRVRNSGRGSSKRHLQAFHRLRQTLNLREILAQMQVFEAKPVSFLLRKRKSQAKEGWTYHLVWCS